MNNGKEGVVMPQMGGKSESSVSHKRAGGTACQAKGRRESKYKGPGAGERVEGDVRWRMWPEQSL